MFDPNELEKIRHASDLWEETTLQKSLARSPERVPAGPGSTKFITTSSDPVERLYTPLDVADMDYARDLNDAGQYPYTRGVARHHVSRQSVDDAHVCGVWHGGRNQRPIQIPARTRRNRTLDRV